MRPMTSLFFLHLFFPFRRCRLPLSCLLRSVVVVVNKLHLKGTFETKFQLPVLTI